MQSINVITITAKKLVKSCLILADQLTSLMFCGAKLTNAEKMSVGNGRVTKTMMDMAEHGLKTVVIMPIVLFLILLIPVVYLYKRQNQLTNLGLFCILATIQRVAIQNTYIWEILRTTQEIKLNEAELLTLAGTKARVAS